MVMLDSPSFLVALSVGLLFLTQFGIVGSTRPARGRLGFLLTCIATGTVAAASANALRLSTYAAREILVLSLVVMFTTTSIMRIRQRTTSGQR